MRVPRGKRTGSWSSRVRMEHRSTIERQVPRTSLFLPVLALAAAGIAMILLAGSLGASTSGRGFLSHQLGTSGQSRDNLTRVRLAGNPWQIRCIAGKHGLRAFTRGTNPGQRADAENSSD